MLMALSAMIKFRRDKYAQWVQLNPIIENGEVIAVTDLPWYKSWFGLKPIKLVLGDGITPVKKLRFI